MPHPPIESARSDPRDLAGGLAVAIDRDFGSLDRWRADFTALAKAMPRGSGSVVLSWSPPGARLVNAHAADHARLPADAAPLLVLDLGGDRHPSSADHTANVDAALKSFFDSLSWKAASGAYSAAIETFSQRWGVEADVATSGEHQFVDVRRVGVFSRAVDLVAGAVWRDPTTLAEGWVDRLDAGRPLIVYCVHGHEVSRAAALCLRSRGVDARFLLGGLDGWRAKGLPTVKKTPPPDLIDSEP